MDSANVAKVLGGKGVLQHKLEDPMDYIELSDRGVSKGALLNLTKYLGLSIKQMSTVLTITERTIQRYTYRSNFSPSVSERILLIARVAARGTDVFGDKDKFLFWLRQPSKALSNRSPMSLMGSSFGAELLMDELGRIEHGVFS